MQGREEKASREKWKGGEGGEGGQERGGGDKAVHVSTYEAIIEGWEEICVTGISRICA